MSLKLQNEGILPLDSVKSIATVKFICVLKEKKKLCSKGDKHNHKGKAGLRSTTDADLTIKVL